MVDSDIDKRYQQIAQQIAGTEAGIASAEWRFGKDLQTVGVSPIAWTAFGDLAAGAALGRALEHAGAGAPLLRGGQTTLE